MKGRKNQIGAQSKYGQAFRDQVARDYEAGDLSYSQIAEKYGLPSKELPKWWVRCYRKKGEIVPAEVLTMTEKEKQEVEALRAENAKLKKQLEDAELRALAYDTMIDVAEEQLGVKIRKKVWHQTVERLRGLPLKTGTGRFCKLFGMSRQAFYEHRWHQDDRNLGAELILELVDKERGDGRFGTRTLMTMLGPAFAEHHIQIGRDRLFDLLAEHDMLIRPRRHYVHTTDSNHHFRKWSNLIENMKIDRPEQVWVSDITYIRTQNGFLYLSIITDAYSKKVMGFNLSHRLEARGAVAALRMALSQRAYPEQPLIHHSDRGIQYCCANYVEVLQNEGIAISMAEKGNPYENAIAERINRTFKEQLGMGATFKNYQQAMAKLIKAVEVYNHRRPHTSCDNMTPEQAHASSGVLKKHWKKRPNKAPMAEALPPSTPPGRFE